ncbi:MAG: hypothetical protein IJZ96_08210 [Lachnospiraceae bacterium]|nr:hypothetical protein [Lachnospiraceae bacterium]
MPLVPEETDDEGQALSEDEYEWYMYLEDKNCFVKYNEYTSRYNRYVIMDVPEGVEVPEGYVEASLTMNGNKVTAYQPDGYLVLPNGKDLKIYLVYAMNIEGDAGFYNYDLEENTFMRYNPLYIEKEVIVIATPTEATPVDATPTNAVPVTDLTDEGFFTKEVITYILFGVSGLLLVFIIVVICLGCKNKNLKDELEDAESMVHQLAGTEAPDKKSKKKATVMDDVDLFANENAASNSAQETEAATEHAPEMSAINEAISEAIDSSQVKTEVTVDNQADGKSDETNEKGMSNNKDNEQAPTEIPKVELSQLEIPQIVDVDYAKQSEDINNKIKENYDANMDSAFSSNDES